MLRILIVVCNEQCSFMAATNFRLVIVLTFDTNITEYLGSGGFFLQTNFHFFNKPFLSEFFLPIESYCCHELKYEKMFHL